METKAWWESKINWTAVVGSIVTLVTLTGAVVPDELTTRLVELLVAGQGLLVVVMRTFYTKKLITNSLAKEN